MTPTYSTALLVLAPGATWTITDPMDYSTISWYSVDIAQPSEEACDNEMARQAQQAPFEFALIINLSISLFLFILV